ncbi:anti-sigma factor [Isoptericola sp. b490]|uniref:anti-sigma factor n=1 Tax=Actinotalea lenta TaxID=3064654 RepID=UPI0027123F68|nr:anti-sigma factor [Isoptericola sp. b490]MDO8121031.1 anti-sigma factor [Isoptericola sp. b490]
MNLHALTGAYVLDALDADERAAFEAHLPGCADCRAEVDSLRAAATTMGAAEATTPPPGLRDLVRDRIARTPQHPPAVAATADAQRADVPVPTQRDARAPARRRRSWSARLTSWPVTAAAASVAVLLAVGGVLFVRSQQTESAHEAAQAEVIRILSAPDMISHDLGLGSSHLVMSPSVDAAAVMGDDVPMPARSGMVYQVWMMHADGSMAAGPTFVPHDGEVMTVVQGDLSDVTAVMVTEEPQGGSKEPTGGLVAELHL